MTKKQKENLLIGCANVFKWVATVLLAVGLSMQLTISTEEMLLASLGLIFTGTVTFIIYGLISHDRSIQLLSTIGFVVVVGSLLDTETARIIAEHSGLALTDEVGFFTKYGKIIITVLKEFV
tara:strand:- start:3832 stop:4197 length:366 start_codon:yes stop_codon:yes gene_type:complete